MGHLIDLVSYLNHLASLDEVWHVSSKILETTEASRISFLLFYKFAVQNLPAARNNQILSTQDLVEIKLKHFTWFRSGALVNAACM